jgi:ribosomal protein L3 glutamine methyltransferase
LNLGELVRNVERRFRAARLHYGHGTDNPGDDAAFLVLRALRLPFDSDLNQALTRTQLARVSFLAKKRIEERIPVAYLLKEAWLDGRSFYVDRRVIVPRSHIAQLLRERMKPWLRRPVRRVLDLCTGSGCLAILAAFAFPRARVDASDLSSAALAVAARNVRQHKLKRRVSLVRSDLFDALEGERYDLIISNPPYVTTGAMRKLPDEYRHEPGLALAGGQRGLDLVSRIVEEAPRHLGSGGLLACEVGDGQASVLRAYPDLPLTWPMDEVFVLAR